MSGNLPERLARALAAICFAITTQSAAAGSFTRECAGRDLEILMLIDEHQDDNSISPERLNDAMFRMSYARDVCYEGHVMDALKIYDSIAESITSDPIMPVQ
jgi:hypothetical protein